MNVEIGIIGGSGLYSLLAESADISKETKFGKPSGNISIGKINGIEVAFLPRHGKRHNIPPHKVPYRANILALKEIGVKRIIGVGTVGSLKKEYKPGDFVVFDQFFNMTNGRDDTIFDSDSVAHVSTAEPYCSELRSIAINSAESMKIKMHEKGTILVVNGPRFSTKAESRFFSASNMDLINMTQYPEVALAREMQMCYLGIGIVTDYDVGLEGEPGIKPVSFDDIARTMKENEAKVKLLIGEIVKKTPNRQSCICPRSLEGAGATINL